MSRWWGNVKRTILLKGSTVNTVAVWSTSIVLSLLWIYQSEKVNPGYRGIFFVRNDAPEFSKYEIQQWNRKYRVKNS
ncbi:conserved Plasmodium protein, unknown function [Babesia microti strain RI]|uniref:Uncharacterized protein n=1 Tax=Babesia microti (strain RI) TaxID=1133968 RepID=A0A1R4AC93_BABMR|nr:conserved Plasmodium protein, unknown function [Babesia microti strain RI]SJK86627.1 conserved Plasmodium protein, unknown function [Babesia microti strain RI]|eukprot:XP_021338763.1 conserved Plasmodium protein, unknown function [Babesia microti strain RI]